MPEFGPKEVGVISPHRLRPTSPGGASSITKSYRSNHVTSHPA